ncbi:MAG: hypothetical protein EA402_03305 [Planctomycetota bacterium]|nr:MAG: hypothetical protein EA402_03305 [Planctomycetota bacterium]
MLQGLQGNRNVVCALLAYMSPFLLDLPLTGGLRFNSKPDPMARFGTTVDDGILTTMTRH